MSIRDNMRKRAEDAKEVLSSFNFQRADLDRTIAVVEAAEKVLAGEPKSETKTGLVIHATQSSLWVDKADCTECKATLQGYQKNWKFCPVCGSTVVKVEKEDSPSDRLTRDAVKHAVDSLTLAGGK
jgi:hypothetical protein